MDHFRLTPPPTKPRDRRAITSIGALALVLLLGGSTVVGAQGALPPGTPPPTSNGMAPIDAPEASTTPHELEGSVLVAALQQGGYVLYMRHGSTDRSQSDSDLGHLDNCGTQRNLSSAGQAQVTAIGQSIAALRIPIGQVLTSPFCRARETARLAFGHSQIVTALNPQTNPDPKLNAATIAAALRPLLSRAPAAGTNTVLVAHADNLAAAAQVSLEEGGIAVFRPLPNGFQLAGVIEPGRWGDLTP